LRTEPFGLRSSVVGSVGSDSLSKEGVSAIVIVEVKEA
jgi:hypothetical protein